MLKEIQKNSELLKTLFSENEFIFLSEFENEFSHIDKQISTLNQYRDLILEQINNGSSDSDTTEILHIIDSNIKNLNSIQSHLKGFNSDLVNLLISIEQNATDSERFERDSKHIQSKISEYSQELKETEKALLLDNSKIRAFMVKINNTDFDATPLFPEKTLNDENDKKKKTKTRTKNSETSTADISLVFNPSNIKDNNKLIISDKRRKVFLPFKISELDEYLQNFENEFSSYEDVISQEFIIPIGRFTKNTVVARFRETYALIRDRESKSVFEALKRGLELMFVYNLNSAIIAACKSEDDLNNYLTHLKNKTTENFDKFKIEYEVSPFKVKSFLFKSSLN